MKIFKNFIRGCKDFWRGLKVLIGITPYARGDKKLAVQANLLRTYIPVAGVGVVRRQIVVEINKHLEREIKKNSVITADELLANVLQTPDYMDMLKDLQLGERDLRFFAKEALKKWGKNDQSKKRKRISR